MRVYTKAGSSYLRCALFFPVNWFKPPPPSSFYAAAAEKAPAVGSIFRRRFSVPASTSVPTMGSQPTAAGLEWPASKVRDTFLQFFQSKDHKCVQSSPVVPHNDPTLLFANAGSFLTLCVSVFYYAGFNLYFSSVSELAAMSNYVFISF